MTRLFIVATEAGGDSPDDAELVARARRGERWAEERLYRRHARDALRLATVALARDAEAEDVVQDAFIKAFTRLGQLREPERFGAWLGRIVTNLARSRLRRRKLLRVLGLDRGGQDARMEDLASDDASPADRAELRALGDALATAPIGSRLAWILRHVEGHALQEVADALDVSLATAKRRLQLANERIIAHTGRPFAGDAPEDSP